MSSDDAAASAFATISAAPNSTEATVTLLRRLADDFQSGVIDHAADHIAGIAAKPGPKRSSVDAALLAEVEALRQINSPAAIGIVVRQHYPGDKAAQRKVAARLRDAERKMSKLQNRHEV